MEWSTLQYLNLRYIGRGLKPLQPHAAAFHPHQAIVAVAIGSYIVEFDALTGPKSRRSTSILRWYEWRTVHKQSYRNCYPRGRPDGGVPPQVGQTSAVPFNPISLPDGGIPPQATPQAVAVPQPQGQVPISSQPLDLNVLGGSTAVMQESLPIQCLHRHRFVLDRFF